MKDPTWDNSNSILDEKQNDDEDDNDVDDDRDDDDDA